MIYLSNAFSLGMLTPEVVLKDIKIEAIEASDVPDAESCVGHADTAYLFGSLLNRKVACNRITVALTTGDTLYVGQLSGPRMSEGATKLPEGATLRWFKVSV